MNEVHASLSLQAAVVAASAIRAVQSMGPLFGAPNGELKGFQEALDSLLVLYRPRPPRAPKPKRAPKPRTALRRKPAPPPEPVVEVDDAESEWDPEPLYEASRCQAFLIEIIRRAAHDYVLYRQHRRRPLRVLAENAFIWLFEEEPGHPAWGLREKAVFHLEEEGKPTAEVGSRRLTSFLSICEACTLDPETVRDRVRKMTVDEIMRAGRHIERRHARPSQDAMNLDVHSVVDGIDVDLLDAENSSSSSDYYDSRDSYSVDHAW